MNKKQMTEMVSRVEAAMKQKKPLELLPYTPFPPARERLAWKKVDSTLGVELINEAHKALSAGFPSLPATLYLDFTLTGNRKRFEDAYFVRRIRLNTLVLAECILHNGLFLSAVIDGVFALCEESGWALPAHNSYERSQPQLALPLTDRPVLDLFACETGAQLALIHYLLQEELDAVSPLICARIRQELKKRIFTPYIQSRFWWMGYNHEKTNNWTVWCTQNVLFAAFMPHILENEAQLPALRLRVLRRAAYSIDRFLSEYGDDGCCDEGAQYYRHAGLCLYGALSVLQEACGREGAAVFSEPKIRNIAEYIMHIHAGGRYYFNFADCASSAGYAGIREYLFGKACNSERLMTFASHGWQARYEMQPLHNYTSSDDTLNLFYLVQELFMSGEVLSYAKQTAKLTAASDYAYPSTGIYLSRSKQFALAVKAGHNADSHNHNDTGSFILYKDEKPFVIDLGVETYSKKTFSAERYEIWTMQSAFHNVSNFDDAMQRDGKCYRATRVQYTPEKDCTTVSMHLEKAYDEDSKLSSYTRTVVHKKNEAVTVTDTVRGDFTTAYFTLMLQEKPELVSAGKKTLTIAVGKASGGVFFGTIEIKSRAPLSENAVHIEPIPVTDERLRQSWPETVYRLRIAYTGSLTAVFS